jgi:apolipoprotein N-acyltransferase
MRDRTAAVAKAGPDLVLWPEAVTPWAIKGDPSMKAFVESLSSQIGAAMIMGSDAIERNADGTERWYNAAFAIDPRMGVQPVYYAKRKLVPFGEYVPLHPIFGWLKKVVPIGEDSTPGTDPSPLLLNLPSGAQQAGVLICYEDVFPSLARESVAAGADFLVVITNDAWYGEEGAAEQHAAHSVLRAVETRRPVLRCGNGGWSGWIDEYGWIQNSLTNSAGSVYFRGSKTFTVTHDTRWVGKQTFFVRFGDWFPLACAFLAVIGWALLRERRQS